MPFTKHATDLFISRRISQVTECGARDLSHEFPSSHCWISNVGLSGILCNHPPDHLRPFAIQLLRRIEMAFEDYSLARQALQDHVRGSRGRWSPYFRALSRFEAAIGHIYIAYDLYRKKAGKNFFASGDQSALDRLNRIYNELRHNPTDDDQMVWITNVGIQSKHHEVSFVELEALLIEYGDLADHLSSTSKSDKPPDLGPL